MGIARKAPRGGLLEPLAGVPRVMVLRNSEIERLEDSHGSVFGIWDGFMGNRPAPTSKVARDIVALGLVGGGMPDLLADALVEKLGPDHLPVLRTLSQALIGVAFTPDIAGDDDEAAPAPAGDAEKKP